MKTLAAGKAVDLSRAFRVQFTAGDNGFPPVGVLPMNGGFARTRMAIKAQAENARELDTHIDVLVARSI